METGKLTIEYMTCKDETDFSIPMVSMYTSNDGMLWFDVAQMAELLECFTPAIRSNLRSLFKSGILREEDCTFTYKSMYPKNHPRYFESTYYNVEVLLALCFRIKTRNSAVVRQWAVRRITEQAQSHLMIWDRD